tara:strand:+ start:2763 stop:3068 length:306 start_codon:yes stop_codon:yes gene_type:complete
MPKKVALPIPVDRWFRDVKRIEELRTVLDSEAFQTAVAILKDTAGPTFGSVVGDEKVNSNRHAWYAGYRDAFSDLHKLTKVQGDKPDTTPQEWTHIQTPQP